MDPNNVTAQVDVLPPGDDNSLSGMLDKAFDKATVDPAAPAPAAQPASEAARPLVGETAGDGGTQQEQQGRQRDQHGRFLPKSAPDATPATASAPAPVAAGAAPAAAPLEAPQSWKDDLKGEWGKIPAPVQAYVHQREQELQQGFQSVAQTKQVAESVLSEFMPYAEQLQKEGATPVTAIRTLLQTAHQLRTGGPEYRKAIIMSLAQQYGVDISQPLNTELAQAQAEAATLSTERIYGQAHQNVQQQAQMQQELNAFAGDPAHEFFGDVRGIMGELIGKGLANNLQLAYDMAIGMHAGVREKLIARAVADHTAANTQQQRASRAATMSVSGAPGGASMQPATAGTDLRASIAAAMGDS